MPLLETAKLTKEYDGRRVLSEVSIAIEPGEAFALIGPSGSGKTTLLRLADLLEFPSSGSIYFDGVDVTHNQRSRLEARRRMSVVQQKPLVFTMSVYDNVACGLRWRHVKGSLMRRKVEDALALVGMSEHKSRHARTLSGGETQRVAIARALVVEPELLFLDEPTANLDPISTSRIEEVVATIIRERRIAVVMATHDMVQGQRLASRIGVLLNGQLMQAGTPGEIFCSPGSRQVAEFVGIENILPGTVMEREGSLLRVAVNDQHVEAISAQATADKVYVLIRPEDITFSLFQGKSSARNAFGGTITKLTPVGPLTRIEVDCGFPLFGILTRSSAQELELHVGKRIFASFKATATHIIQRWS